jgi:hypothetical protein
MVTVLKPLAEIQKRTSKRQERAHLLALAGHRPSHEDRPQPAAEDAGEDKPGETQSERKVRNAIQAQGRNSMHPAGNIGMMEIATT